MARKIYILGSAAQLAKAEGVSVHTARRRASTITGAVKTPKGWQIPLTTGQYAKAQGISYKSARRQVLASPWPTREMRQQTVIQKFLGLSPNANSVKVTKNVMAYDDDQLDEVESQTPDEMRMAASRKDPHYYYH